MADKLGLVGSDPSHHAATELAATTIQTAGVPHTLVPGRTSPGMAIALPDAGYELGEVIGRGGMGEVLAARDLRIGRDVALKRMRAESPSAEALTRFLREARVQARLDHPAIVPVHEMGIDDKGLPYFTMKRLAGATLADRIKEGMPLNRMLRAFVDVCLAIELAHTRGVVHRDLKPSNIMLGNFGEVYVLDWGIARVIGEEIAAPAGIEDIDTLDESTKSGAILGTPGYMAPEQVRGTMVTPQADIYSLGALLFEMLAGEPLHPRGTSAIASTLGSPQMSPAVRRVDTQVPPELDRIAFDCLAELPEHRPTAHELAERVEAYLDGDRDLAQRRRLAAVLATSARETFDAGGPDAREMAMRKAGRAVVLDPENEEAGALVGRLVLDAPTVIPPALAAELETLDRELSRKRSRQALVAYLSLAALAPLNLIADVRSWAYIGAFYGVAALGALSTWRSSRTGVPRVAVVLCVNLMQSLMFTRMASPFVITPLATCCFMVIASPIKGMRPAYLYAWTATAVLLPFVLEWAGVLPESWWIRNGQLELASGMYFAHGRLEEIVLVVMTTVFTLVIAFVTITISRQRREAADRASIQAWHLRQVLPTRAAPGAAPATSPQA